MFVQVDSSNLPVKWPLSHGDILSLFPNVSFPLPFQDVDMPELGLFVLTDGTIPTPSRFEKIEERPPIQIDGTWTRQWEVISFSEEEKQSALEAMAATHRKERNSRLERCDWTQLADAPVDSSIWAAYRQELRDISSQPGFPWEINWPIPPS